MWEKEKENQTFFLKEEQEKYGWEDCLDLNEKNIELLFLWIKEYKKLKNIGINFSNKYKFTYDNETKRLFKEKYTHFISNYFPNPIKNLTAIIGANGTGKTTLIKFILQYFTEGVSLTQIPALVVIKMGEGLVIYHPKDIEVEKKDKEEYLDSSLLSVHTGLPFTTLIYHTNFYDPFLIEETDLTKQEFHGMYNLSTFYLLDSDSETYLNRDEQLTYKEKINYHILMELNRQVSFICEFYKSGLELNLPRYLIIRLNNIAERYLTKEMKDGIHSELNPLLTSWVTISKALEGKKNDRDSFLFKVALKGIINFIKDAFYSTGIMPPQIKKIYEKMINEFSKVFLKNIDSNGINKNYQEYLKEIKSENEEVSDSFFDALEYLGLVLKLLSNNSNLKLVNTQFGYFDFTSTTDNERDKVVEIVNNYYLSVKFTNYLDFIFSHDNKQITNLSSGEYTLLALFSRIFWLKFKTGINLEKNILFLIDEAELAFHPRWQRSFIKYFVDFLAKSYSSYNVQVILTSHSPFILSDLPPNNVIFLKDVNGVTKNVSNLENFPNTLAANIHELLSDSFFMDNKLVGDYVKDKIQAVIQLLQKESLDDDEKSYIKDFIEILGEPFLKAKLLDLYNKKYEQ